MKLVQMNWSPTNRQLCQFGCIAAVALPGLVYFWSSGNPLATGVCAAIGLLAAIAGFVQPQWLRPIFIALSLIALPIGLVMGEVVTFLVFALVFLPMALAFRVLGRDALKLKIDRSAKTYWQAKQQPSGPASYFQQW